MQQVTQSEAAAHSTLALLCQGTQKMTEKREGMHNTITQDDWNEQTAMTDGVSGTPTMGQHPLAVNTLEHSG
jgi:hypothetical protein